MKLLAAFLIIISITFSSPVESSAQWKRSGPDGAQVCGMTVSGSDLLLFTTYRIFRSTDGGITWMPAPTITNGDDQILTLLPIQNKLFAGTRAGIYISADNGKTWTSAINGLQTSAYRYVCALAHTGNTIFAGTDSGIFVSKNEGANWTCMSNGLTGMGREVMSLSVSDTAILAGTVDGIYRSTDSGATWTKTIITTDGSSDACVSFCTSGSYILAGTTRGLFRSSDGGSTWTAMSTGIANFYAMAFGISGNKVFAGTPTGCYSSINNGASWTLVDTGLPAYATSVYSIVVTDSVISAGTSSGTIRSRDGGNTWNAANAGLTGSDVISFAASENDLYAGTTIGAFHSADGGIRWTPVNNGLTFAGSGINALAVSGGNLIAGTWKGVFLSTDKGLNWTAVSNGLPSYEVHSLLDVDSVLYAGLTGRGVYRSRDHGLSWTAINKGLWLSTKIVYDIAASGTNLFAGRDDGLFRSVDNGESWSAVALPEGFSGRIRALAAYGSTLWAGGTMGIIRSTDHGTTWTIVRTDAFPGVYDIAVHGKTLIAAVNGGGIFVSEDDGDHWKAVNEGLTEQSAAALCVFNSCLFTGTWSGGAWRRPLSEMLTSVNPGPVEPPSHFSLDQNFPNPFNPSTTISLTLAHAGFTTLKIFNMLGQEVARLISEELPAGHYTRTWNAEGMPSGTFYYRLQSGAYSETKKLLLIR